MLSSNANMRHWLRLGRRGGYVIALDLLTVIMLQYLNA